MKYMTLNILGQDFPVLETVVKPKPGQQLDPAKTYFTFREPTRATGAFGVGIKALDEHLPTQVMIDGVAIYLLPGKTAATYVDRESKLTVIVPESDRRPLVAFNGLQTFPTLQNESDTGIRTVQVTISLTKDEQWNVKVVVRKAATAATPEARKAAAERKADDAMATFAAFFAAQKAAESVPTPADVARLGPFA